MPNELLMLAEKVEAAEPWMQTGLLLDAWDLIAPLNGAEWAKGEAGTFCAMVECGAFESAALMLVPNGAFWRCGHDGEGADPSLFDARVFEPMTMESKAVGTASTPALALTAAALGAKASQQEQEA